MTTQITDSVRYLDESYKLIWDGCLVPSIRKRYNLYQLIGGETTECYRGYVAEYEIQNAHLYLCSLQIFAMFHPYPLIAGVAGEDVFYKAKNRKREPINSGWVKFSPLQERIDVSGYLLLGQGMKGYEVYMQEAAYYPHACKKLLGITLVNGQPKLVEDFSQEAADIRQQVPKPYLLDENDRHLVGAFSKKVMKINR